MSEKVEYFGNRDIIVYLFVSFGLGITLGISFAQYKNLRFSLIKSRLDNISKLNVTYNDYHGKLNSPERLAVFKQIQELKGRSLDTGCTIKDGIYLFNHTYQTKPKIMLGMNGLLINSTKEIGVYKQWVNYTWDSQQIQIHSIKPAAQEIHVCWLVVPDLGY